MTIVDSIQNSSFDPNLYYNKYGENNQTLLVLHIEAP